MMIPLLVFADDWGRHPSSCQHLVRRLLPEHPTLWVNTIGTRAPKFDLATMQRATGKLRQWLRPPSPTNPSGSSPAPIIPPNLQVANPRMWPWLRRPFDRRLNRRLLVQQLRNLISAMPDAPVAVTTLPVVADLMPVLPVRRWVYYCVDDFGQWPGLDRRSMTRMESQVVTQADRIVCVSDNLRTRLRDMGRDSELLTHGVDYDFWQSTQAIEGIPPHLPQPWIVFWGVIDRRMDITFLRQLSTDLQQGTILLVGPEQEPDPALERLPRIHRLGPVPIERLPAIARDADVLIMPYDDLPVTRAMQPLKLKEYLATCKPAVARNLPANREWADALDLVDTSGGFSQRVHERLRTGLPQEQAQARQRLHQESWDQKALQFARILFEE